MRLQVFSEHQNLEGFSKAAVRRLRQARKLSSRQSPAEAVTLITELEKYMTRLELNSDGNELQYDLKGRSEQFSSHPEGKSLTVQADADDADINTIVRRFGLTGVMPQGLVPPTYADFDEVFDFHSAQIAVARASEMFMAMPADIRNRFMNDPQVFLDYAENPANIDGLRELGLAVPKAAPPPAPTSQTPPTEAPKA
ncbi:internal scaffolding protein [Blackfly microvirus SF02]|uniref:Internal scaffolding protein n=1 Tax=Blackfly microvirus SF02 TaxID=2576452 RepID=A0A4P8PQ71_9VIRU|nr:internal scaffolding protein [Blackfly microvirus SF02]